MSNLQQLLYRKEMLEHNLDKNSKSITIWGNLIESIKSKITETKDEFEKNKLEVELEKLTWEMRTHVTRFKLNKRDYEHNLLPSIERITTEEQKKSIEFKDFEKKAKELANYEIYGKCVKLSPKTEHIFTISSSEKYIKKLEDLLNEAIKKQQSEKDDYNRSKLEKEIFETEIHISTLKKRLSSRIEYYEEQFLPMFESELEEAKKYCDSYVKRANQIVAEGVDIQLKFVLDKYDDMKKDDEDLWLFYTAVKNRVNSVIEELKRQENLHENFKYLTEPVHESI